MSLQCHLAYDARVGGERLPLSGSTVQCCAAGLQCKAHWLHQPQDGDAWGCGCAGANGIPSLGCAWWHQVFPSALGSVCSREWGRHCQSVLVPRTFLLAELGDIRWESSGRMVGWCV